MSLRIESKEELHLRMTELQQKLKNSEEERKKLEKTCDVLIKAFREEQRMHYKALNSQYKKFLQDCNIRSKRNDIILRSLCRVEDKAKSIFAKTERLKLLKDHYISYLKQNEFQEATESRLKTSFSFLQNTISNEAAPKSVHWKTPVVAEVQEYRSAKDLDGHDENARGVPDLVEKERFEQELVEVSSSNLRSDSPKRFLSERRREWNSDGNLQNLTVHEIYEEGKEKERSPIHKSPSKEKSPSELSLMQTKVENFKESDLPSRQSITAGPDVLPATITRKKQPEIQQPPVPSGTNVPPWIVNSVQNRSELFQESGEIEGERRPGNALAGKDRSRSLELESPDLKQVKALRERGVLKHRESIDKLKIALEDYGEVDGSKEEEEKMLEDHQRGGEKRSGRTIVEKKETEGSEKGENWKDRTTLHSFNEESVQDVRGNEDGDAVSGDEEVTKGENKVYPKGLDGVDYENETYPESYYEQPAKTHDYSNLASNVILEEDEYELYADQQEAADDVIRNQPVAKGFSLRSSPLRLVFPPNFEVRSETDKKIEGRGIDNDDGDDDKLAGNSNLIGDGDPYESRDSERGIDKSNDEKEVLPNAKKSNLLHLLESDSESFQIEHGDELNSGNEDSDFDFSFGQNPE